MTGLPALDSYIRDVASVRMQAVEDRLRQAVENGEREVMFIDTRDGSSTLYVMPTWRRNPINRFKLFWHLGV